MTAIATAAQALSGLLRAAEEGGLPMPSSANASDIAPGGHEVWDTKDARDMGGIVLAFLALADLADWAIWLERPIDDSRTTALNRHHNVYGYAGPVPVNAYALTPLAAEVSA